MVNARILEHMAGGPAYNACKKRDSGHLIEHVGQSSVP
jgi:hypothetical protein